MSVYQRFCREVFDRNGRLQKITLSYPDDFNFGYDVVDRIAAETPEKKALVWCSDVGEERIFSFADIKTRSNMAANVFRRAGIGRGDRVMLVLKRHYEYWFAAIALHKLGAVMIPATHMLTASDLAYRIRAAGVKGIVATPQNDVPEKITEALKGSGTSVRLWSVRQDTDGFENLTDAMDRAGDSLERVPTLASDPMMLYFTSGTTGEPKGVIHDHTYPLAHIVTAKYWQQAEDNGLHFTVADTGWGKASWGKLYGQWLVGSAVMVYDFDRFDPKQLTAVINRYGVTSFCAPPTVYRCLIRKGLPGMPSLRHATTAGERLEPEMFRRFAELTDLTLREGYGQTETTLLTACFRGFDAVEGSMGVPSPFYHIELRDENGQAVGPGETGEIVIIPEENGRQLGVFRSYLDNEEQYRYVWRGGVYHTGDLAHCDENGYYWFHGRADELIKTGGFRIGPSEVESVLMEHPAVAECCVTGVSDPLRGQAIKAFVVLCPGCTPSAGLEFDIRNHANLNLAEYKWIRSIEFVAELPKTISGKIRRKLLSCRDTRGIPGNHDGVVD